MEHMVKVVGVAVLFCGALFVLPILAALGGAFSGWVVGGVFPGTMGTMLAWMGLDCAPWQFGVMVGFVGGFLKTRVSKD